jgi:hypothetical protein
LIKKQRKALFIGNFKVIFDWEIQKKSHILIGKSVKITKSHILTSRTLGQGVFNPSPTGSLSFNGNGQKYQSLHC